MSYGKDMCDAWERLFDLDFMNEADHDLVVLEEIAWTLADTYKCCGDCDLC